MMIDRFWELLSKKIFSEATDAELKEYEEFVSGHPELGNTAETLDILAYQSVPLEKKDEIEQAFDRHIQKMRDAGIEFIETGLSNNFEIKAKRKKSLRRWAVVLSIVSVAFVVFLVSRRNFDSLDHVAKQKVQLSQVTTKPAQKAQLQLPDGSIVWLNASSNLTYDKDFGKNLREVNLTGEAFFDVVKDPSHPFIIHTKVIDVKVLGTQFNVKAYPNDAYTETSVIRGTVEVTRINRPNEKLLLRPNEKTSVANNPMATESSVRTTRPKPFFLSQPLTYNHSDNTVIETSWMQDKLIFQENETFGEVALKMERWYGVQISFADEEVKQMRPFGSFTTETINEALDDLKETLRFNYKISGNNITITK